MAPSQWRIPLARSLPQPGARAVDGRPRSRFRDAPVLEWLADGGPAWSCSPEPALGHLEQLQASAARPPNGQELVCSCGRCRSLSPEPASGPLEMARRLKGAALAREARRAPRKSGPHRLEPRGGQRAAVRYAGRLVPGAGQLGGRKSAYLQAVRDLLRPRLRLRLTPSQHKHWRHRERRRPTRGHFQRR